MRKFVSQQLQNRYNQDKSFKQKIDKQQRQYSQILQNSLKKTQLKIYDQMLMRYVTSDNKIIYMMFGYLQPKPSQYRSDLTIYFLRNFQPLYGQKYTFVYFNNHTESADYYFQFKYLINLLPLKFVEGLRQFILVQPTFYIKACDSLGLGASNKVFDNRSTSVDTTKQLLVKLKIPPKDFVTIVPQKLAQQFPKQLKRKQKQLTNYRVNLYGQNLSQSQTRQKNEFQCMVKALITKQIYKLQNFELGDRGIPIILQLLVFYFKTKPHGLKQQGIFRKSVSIDQQNQTLGELSKRNFEYLQKINNPHLIASLIKKFFSNLKQPIIHYSVYQQLLNDVGIKDRKQHVKDKIKQIPQLNFMSLAFVIDFLRKQVISNQKNNKMSAHNLAICFAPCFMRSQSAPTFLEMANSMKAVGYTQIMINDFEYIFGTDAQIELYYKKYAKNKTKDFKRQINQDLDFIHDQKSSQHSRQSSNYQSLKFNVIPNQKSMKSQQFDIKLLQNQKHDMTKVTKSCVNKGLKTQIKKQQAYSLVLTEQQQQQQIPHEVSIPSPKNNNQTQLLQNVLLQKNMFPPTCSNKQKIQINFKNLQQLQKQQKRTEQKNKIESQKQIYNQINQQLRPPQRQPTVNFNYNTQPRSPRQS